jgi:hypothetical protein
MQRAHDMRLRDLMSYDNDQPVVPVDDEVRLELRRVANLFLLSSVTLALVLLRAAALALQVTFIPQTVGVVWSIVLLTGWAASYVYALWVTFQDRRWGWLALCAVPFASVPAGVAYAWVRRQEIEDEVLGDARGGRGKGDRGPER